VEPRETEEVRHGEHVGPEPAPVVGLAALGHVRLAVTAKVEGEHGEALAEGPGEGQPDVGVKTGGVREEERGAGAAEAVRGETHAVAARGELGIDEDATARHGPGVARSPVRSAPSVSAW
jgi:hypothetical protein